MVGLHHLAEPFGLHVGIDLGGRNVSMAKHLLDRAQVRPTFQQVAGKTMAQHVRREPCSIEPGLAGERLQLQREMLPRQVARRT